MDLTTTNRGFDVAVFTDFYGSECSIQKSSLATEDCIWLGVDKHFNPENEGSSRMHLTREMVRELLPLLHQFEASGELKKPLLGYSYKGHEIWVGGGKFTLYVDNREVNDDYESAGSATDHAIKMIDQGYYDKEE